MTAVSPMLDFRDVAEVRRYLELRRDLTEAERSTIGVPILEMHVRGMLYAFNECLMALDTLLYYEDMRERRDEPPVTPDEAPF